MLYHQLNPFLTSTVYFQRLSLFFQFFIISNVKRVISYWFFALEAIWLSPISSCNPYLSLKATIIECIF
jgi:hypothetical protein